MKRLLAAIAVVGMSVALFAGCGSAVNAQTNTVAQTTATESETSSAADSSDSSADEMPEKYRENLELTRSGISFKVPEQYKDLNGQLMAYDLGESNYGSGIFQALVLYISKTDAEENELAASLTGKTPEEAADIRDAYYNGHLATILHYVTVKEDIDINAALSDLFPNPEKVSYTEIGHENGYKYYFLSTPVFEAFKDSTSEELFTEYKTLIEDNGKLITEYTFAKPQTNANVAEAGTKLSFETKDLNGNTVKSEDLFKDHKVTMINLWGTYCEPCKGELAALEEYNKKLADMDCQVIGICVDTMGHDEKIAVANELLKEHGVTYTNLVMTEEILSALPMEGLPTTYFVGSDGTILTLPVKCANFDSYDERIQEALEAIG